MTTIEIETINGRVPVEAEIIGPLAIHPVHIKVAGEHIEIPTLFGVTHIATGLSITDSWCSTQSQARRLAHRLQDLADWSFADLVGFEQRKPELTEARKQVTAEIDGCRIR